MLINSGIRSDSAVDSVDYDCLPATSFVVTVVRAVSAYYCISDQSCDDTVLADLQQGLLCGSIAAVADICMLLLQGLGCYWVSQDALGQ